LCELTEGIDPFELFKKITDLAQHYTLGHATGVFKRYRATLLKCINQMTKPRITKAQFDFAFNNYRGIYRGKLEIDNRLYPLPEQKYHEIAMNIWRKRGMPKFRKRKITGVKFGLPVTTDYLVETNGEGYGRIVTLLLQVLRPTFTDDGGDY